MNFRTNVRLPFNKDNLLKNNESNYKQLLEFTLDNMSRRYIVL